MITVDAAMTVNITTDAVILAETSIVNDSCAWHNDQYE